MDLLRGFLARRFVGLVRLEVGLSYVEKVEVVNNSINLLLQVCVRLLSRFKNSWYIARVELFLDIM